MSDERTPAPLIRGLAATVVLTVVATVSGDGWAGLAAAVTGVAVTVVVARGRQT